MALASLAARPRSVWSRTALRRRTDLGVTSTHLSSAMNSNACSSDTGRGGINFSKLSLPDDRGGVVAQLADVVELSVMAAAATRPPR